MTDRCVLWIVGEPGVGKTTVARALLESYGPKLTELRSPKFTRFGPPMIDTVAAAGWWRGMPFDGADTLGISEIKSALAYWRDQLTELPLAVFDGDKLASASAVECVRAAGARMVCFLLADELGASARRLQRGTHQNSIWVKGRRTKARNFYESFPGKRFECEYGLYEADALALMMREAVSP